MTKTPATERLKRAEKALDRAGTAFSSTCDKIIRRIDWLIGVGAADALRNDLEAFVKVVEGVRAAQNEFAEALKGAATEVVEDRGR